mgnify:CR=1 FL=1
MCITYYLFSTISFWAEVDARQCWWYVDDWMLCAFQIDIPPNHFSKHSRFLVYPPLVRKAREYWEDSYRTELLPVHEASHYVFRMGTVNKSRAAKNKHVNIKNALILDSTWDMFGNVTNSASCMFPKNASNTSDPIIMINPVVSKVGVTDTSARVKIIKPATRIIAAKYSYTE